MSSFENSKHFVGKSILQWTNNLKNYIDQNKIKLGKYVLCLAIFSFAFLFWKKLTVFIFLIIIGGYIKYIVLKYISRFDIPFDFSPIFFLSVLIINYYGFSYMLVFIFLADIIPSFFVVGIIDPLGLPYYILIIGLAYISTLFSLPISSIGVFVSLAYFGLGLGINYLYGNIEFKPVVNSFFHLGVNLVYFLRIAPLITPLLN